MPEIQGRLPAMFAADARVLDNDGIQYRGGRTGPVREQHAMSIPQTVRLPSKQGIHHRFRLTWGSTIDHTLMDQGGPP
jgi:hypothetical protein